MSVKLIEKQVIMDPVTFQPIIKANVEISAQVSIIEPFGNEGKTDEQFYQELGKQVYEAAIKPSMFVDIEEDKVEPLSMIKDKVLQVLDTHWIAALDYETLDMNEDIDMIVTLQLVKNKD